MKLVNPPIQENDFQLGCSSLIDVQLQRSQTIVHIRPPRTKTTAQTSTLSAHLIDSDAETGLFERGLVGRSPWTAGQMDDSSRLHSQRIFKRSEGIFQNQRSYVPTYVPTYVPMFVCSTFACFGS